MLNLPVAGDVLDDALFVPPEREKDESEPDFELRRQAFAQSPHAKVKVSASYLGQPRLEALAGEYAAVMAKRERAEADGEADDVAFGAEIRGWAKAVLTETDVRLEGASFRDGVPLVDALTDCGLLMTVANRVFELQQLTTQQSFP